MNLKAYIKGCERGEFSWNCIESGTYGDGNSVDVEDVTLKNRIGRITRQDFQCFEAEVDDFEIEPYYDTKEFTSRLSARKW